MTSSISDLYGKYVRKETLKHQTNMWILLYIKRKRYQNSGIILVHFEQILKFFLDRFHRWL